MNVRKATGVGLKPSPSTIVKTAANVTRNILAHEYVVPRTIMFLVHPLMTRDACSGYVRHVYFGGGGVHKTARNVRYVRFGLMR